MKDVTCGIVAMLICVAMISCDKKKKELKESVAKANQECPIDMGMIGSTTSISYDENSNELVYNLDMKEDFSNVKILSENPTMMKKSVMSTISTGSESFKKTIDSIIEVEGSLKFVLNGLKTGATAEIALNSEELKAAREMEVTPLSALETVIDITNLQMPIDNGQGMKTVALRLMGDNVTYICEMDPNLYNISRFESNRDLVKEEIIQFLRQLGSVEQIFFHQIIAAEKNLAYLYCYEDGVDGDSFTIVVSKEELSELLE